MPVNLLPFKAVRTGAGRHFRHHRMHGDGQFFFNNNEDFFINGDGIAAVATGTTTAGMSIAAVAASTRSLAVCPSGSSALTTPLRLREGFL